MESMQSSILISNSILIQRQDTWKEILVFYLSYSLCLLTMASGPFRVSAWMAERKRHIESSQLKGTTYVFI